MADEINPITGKPYSTNPRAQSARRKRNRRKSDDANEAENERVLQRQRDEWEAEQERKENEAIDVEDLKQQEDMKQGNYLESKKMDEIYAKDKAANSEFDRLVEEAKGLTGRAKAAKLKQAGRIREGNTGMAISEVPGAAWGVAESYAQSMMEDPAAISEHFTDLYADYQAAAKGAAVMAPVPVPGARIAGAVGGVAVRRIGKKALKEFFDWSLDSGRRLIYGDEVVDAATGMTMRIDNADDFTSAKPLMSKGSDNIPMGGGDPKGIRSSSKFGNRTYWDNLSENNQKLFTEAGLTDDDAIFLLSNWDTPISRKAMGAIEGGTFSDSTFEFMKSELLPEILNDLKGIDFTKVKLELDHVAQLRAILPFWNKRKVKQFPKIRQILLNEGIFSGNNPKNLRYMPNDVHKIKSRFWIDQIGADGNKFFKNRRLDTYAQVETAAKEMKKIINRSNDIVDKLTGQYYLQHKRIMSSAELEAILRKVDLNYGTYNLKEVRKLVREIKTDDIKRSLKGLDELDEAVQTTAEIDDYSGAVRQVIQDTDPTDLPKRKPIRSKKKQLEKDLKKDSDPTSDTFQPKIDPSL